VQEQKCGKIEKVRFVAFPYSNSPGKARITSYLLRSDWPFSAFERLLADRGK
jgi:hypothetical protein